MNSTMSAMSIKISVNGFDVTVSNAVEAVAILRELAESTRTEKKGPGRPKLKPRKPLDSEPDSDTGTLGFLTKVASGGRNGVMAEDLMAILGVTNPKGVGGRSVRVNNELKALGFNPNDVFRKERNAEGRIWKPGPKMDAAIEAVKKGGG
jgi:hypothetical protein